jgi:G3E family GTPase
VKRDGRKDKSSDLNSVNEEPINVFNTLATNGKEREKSSVDPRSAKFERKELKRSKNKRGALLSKTEEKLSHPLGLSNWQKKELQKLSAQELRKKGMAWIPKGSTRTQDMGDDQAKGATQLKEKKRYERRSSKLRFAPNHQSYWSLPNPFALQIPHMPMIWNSSLDMLDYPSYSYLVLGFEDHVWFEDRWMVASLCDE